MENTANKSEIMILKLFRELEMLMKKAMNEEAKTIALCRNDKKKLLQKTPLKLFL